MIRSAAASLRIGATRIPPLTAVSATEVKNSRTIPFRRLTSPLAPSTRPASGEFQQAPLDAHAFEDLPGRWQAAILTAEQNRPKLRVVTSD